MAPGLHFSCWWLFVCWLVATVAEGQEVVNPPGGSQNNANPTDCQIFTLTPPATTRKPVTRVQHITRAPTYTFHVFPQGRPRVFPRFPGSPFHPLNCDHRFHFWPFYWPYGRLTPGRYLLGRRLQVGSSSEESREKREVRAY